MTVEAKIYRLLPRGCLLVIGPPEGCRLFHCRSIKAAKTMLASERKRAAMNRKRMRWERTMNAIRNHGIWPGITPQMSDKQLMRIPGIGRNVLRFIRSEWGEYAPPRSQP